MICRACGSRHLISVLDLGTQPPSNAYKTKQFAVQPAFPLEIGYCSECWLLQVMYDVYPGEIFNEDYAYFSENSQTWLDHTKAYCDMAVERFGLNRKKSIVLEVGGNDGHLLQHLVDRTLRVVNIDPSASVVEASRARGIETWCEYFRPQQMQCDLIIANNVMAHVPDLYNFVRALYLSLKPNGTATIEFPHALKMIEGVQFDTIYHEHYSYLSVTALAPLLAKCDLYIYDVEELPTHGGSLRLYIGRAQGAHVVEESVYKMLVAEAPLRSHRTYEIFRRKTEACRYDFMSWIRNHQGVFAYGAAAKGNTFLNYCGITAADIQLVGDTTKAKQGKFLPGSCIPIVDEDTLMGLGPEWVLILPWNWREEIIAKLTKKYGAQRFVTAVPQLTF